MGILVIGASGFIGNSLYSFLKSKDEKIIGTYYNRPKDGLIKTDMTSKNNLESLFKKCKPNIVYMPAFIPSVDYCELHDEVRKINELGIRNIVDVCKKFNSKLIFFSSDYIFDGKNGPYLETDKPIPINKYGETKLLCEKIVKELISYLIIRTTVVYGYDLDSKNFLMTFTCDLKNNIEKKVPIDQIGSPTFVDDLSSITIQLVEKNKNGIYNVVGPDYCSRYVFALKIARIFDLNEALIKPVTSNELNQPATRPLKAGLIIDKIRTEINANPKGINNVLNNLKRYFI